MFLLTTVGIVDHCHSPMRHSDRLLPFRTTSPSKSFAAKHVSVREVAPSTAWYLARSTHTAVRAEY